MLVKQLTVKNFRNIDEACIEPAEGVNVIFGENAQGKTNLLESIWLFTGCKSFRSKRDRELVGFSRDFVKNEMTFLASGREQTACLYVDTKRTAMKNGVTLQSPAQLIGSFNAVIFAPTHLSLVKEGPMFRRRFLDTALCQIRPQYAKVLARYNHTLAQRNALLKDVGFHPELLDTLEIWDERLSDFGASVAAGRLWYTEQIGQTADSIYAGLSGNREKLKIDYVNNIGAYTQDVAEIKTLLKEELQKSRRDDIFNKMTTTGPHRDDLHIQIDGLSARTFGSQGQQRCAALAMKLSEAEILKAQTGEEPVILLDDVMSELDENRQDYILNHIGGRQVFVTCCDPTAVLRLCEGRTFHMEKGRVL